MEPTTVTGDLLAIFHALGREFTIVNDYPYNPLRPYVCLAVGVDGDGGARFVNRLFSLVLERNWVAPDGRDGFPAAMRTLAKMLAASGVDSRGTALYFPGYVLEGFK